MTSKASPAFCCATYSAAPFAVVGPPEERCVETELALRHLSDGERDPFRMVPEHGAVLALSSLLIWGGWKIWRSRAGGHHQLAFPLDEHSSI